jgi:hypothetical protein
MLEGLTPGALLFMEWLIDPRGMGGIVTYDGSGAIAEDSESKGTVKEFCTRHGFHEKTVARWRKDDVFQAQYRQEVEKELRDPTHMMEVIRSVRAIALNGQGKDALSAADLYSRLTNYQAPTPPRQTKAAKELTDEELEKQLAAEAAPVAVVRVI